MNDYVVVDEHDNDDEVDNHDVDDTHYDEVSFCGQD